MPSRAGSGVNPLTCAAKTSFPQTPCRTRMSPKNASTAATTARAWGSRARRSPSTHGVSVNSIWRAIGAHLMQAATGSVRFENCKIVGPLASVSIQEIASVWYRSPDRLPPDVDPGGLEASVAYRPEVDTGAFSYATHAAAVAVDPRL